MNSRAVLVAVAALAASGLLRAEKATEAPLRLADTGLYADGRVGAIDGRNRPFSPQYPLWSDGLTKRRWVYLPPGAAIDGRDEHQWQFPVGTRLWKEFSAGGRRVETRMLWKTADETWTFATYVWNADGSDAVRAPADGVLTDIEVAPGRRHAIPSSGDCAACHGNRRAKPLGFTALQLSTNRDPNAIHGEPLRDGMVTLATLAGARQLSHARRDLVANPPRIRTSSPATRAVLGYLAANCGACHDGSGDIAALGPVIRMRDLTRDGDAVARSLVAQRTQWQIPGAADGASVLVHPGAPERSALFLRLRSRSPSSQMPPLGTVVRDQEALDAIRRWIMELTPFS